MPGGNGSGPNGMGPLTGRGAGFCAGSDVPGFRGSGRGRGFGLGFGRGLGGGRGARRGLRGWWGTGPGRFVWSEGTDYLGDDPELEKGYLTRLVRRIEQRLSELEGSESSEHSD